MDYSIFHTQPRTELTTNQPLQPLHPAAPVEDDHGHCEAGGLFKGEDEIDVWNWES